MLQELWARVNPRERIVALGAAVVVAGWLVGAATTDGWYGAIGAQPLGLLAVAAAVAAVAVIYLRISPNRAISWPTPIPVVYVLLAAVAGTVALLGLLQAIAYDSTFGFGLVASMSKTPLVYLVTLAVVAGAGVMATGAYQEWQLDRPSQSKPPARSPFSRPNPISPPATPTPAAPPAAPPSRPAPKED